MCGIRFILPVLMASVLWPSMALSKSLEFNEAHSQNQLMYAQGMFANVDAFINRTLDLKEHSLIRPDHLGVSSSLDNLVQFYLASGRHDEAAPLRKHMPHTSEDTLGPSFDCAKASTSVEYTICASEELSALDRRLAAAYRAAKDSTAPESTEHVSLMVEQRHWNKRRSSTCSDIDEIKCLAEMYGKRINELYGVRIAEAYELPVYVQALDEQTARRIRIEHEELPPLVEQPQMVDIWWTSKITEESTNKKYSLPNECASFFLDYGDENIYLYDTMSINDGGAVYYLCKFHELYMNGVYRDGYHLTGAAPGLG